MEEEANRAKQRAEMEADQEREIRKLLEEGFSALERDEDGASTLDAALKDSEVNILRLVASFCDISEIDIHEERHKSFFQSIALELSDLEFLRRWKSMRGSTVDIRSSRDRVPLHVACCNFDHSRSSATVSYLLSEGSNPNAVDKDGATPLHFVACAIEGDENPPVFKSRIHLLLKAGADINARDRHNRTPLHCCRFDKGKNCVFELLRFGGDVNSINDFDLNVIDHLYVDIMDKGYTKDLETRQPVPEEMEFYECARILLQHYMSLEVLGLPLTPRLKVSVQWLSQWFYFVERNLTTLPAFSEKYLRDGLNTDDILTFHTKCKREGEKLKNFRLPDGLSLYGMLFANHHQLSRLVKRRAYESYFEEHRYQEDFPILWYFLEIQYRAGIVRNILKPLARSCIRSLELPLPEVCLENILTHFSNVELKDFVERTFYVRKDVTSLLFRSNAFNDDVLIT